MRPKTMQSVKRWSLRLYAAIVVGTAVALWAASTMPPELLAAIYVRQIGAVLFLSALLLPPIVLGAFMLTTVGLAIYALGLVYLVPLWRRLARSVAS